jgi:hemolysin activation/secretion protein
MWGDRAITTSVEYRVPLALVGQLLGHLPFGNDKLSLTLFADAGSAWTNGSAVQLARLRSLGAELVGDMTISYDAPLRLRVGVARPMAPPPSGLSQDVVVYVALSASF